MSKESPATSRLLCHHELSWDILWCKAVCVKCGDHFVERETRRVYKASAEEYQSYINARFKKANSGHRFRWQDKEWRYEHSDFDERGDFDLLIGSAHLPIEAKPDPDAARFRFLVADPETARHLLSLLHTKRGDADSLRRMIDRITASKEAARG